MKIHPSAEIHPSAQLGRDVEVGANAVIGPDVVVGDETRIEPNVVIWPWTTIGRCCEIGCGAALGGKPQDHKFKGERTYLEIGDRNQIREYVTIHRATGQDDRTVIGNDNLLMAYCHIGHNCTIGSGIMIANQCGISGHVTVEDRVVFGGMVGVHQFVRIGRLAMLGGMSKVTQDIPPFMLADGRPTKVYDVNKLGLRRAGISPAARAGLKQAFKFIYRSDMNLSQALETIESEIEPSEERDYLLSFLSSVKFGYAGRQDEPARIRE